MLKKISSMIIKYFYDLFHFGIKIAHYNFIGEFADFNYIKGNRAEIIKSRRKEAIYNWLVRKYKKLINDYKFKDIKIGKNQKVIWCLWWQGLDKAPALVKKCIKSIEKNKGDYDVVIITKNNYKEFADIPFDIISKLNKRIITITHFSDILRAHLLATHGGIWVDATMFFYDDVTSYFNDSTFNSCACLSDDTHPDYTGFFMGGKPNRLFMFLYDFLVQYNRDYRKLINYFLIDYAILIAYRNFNDCKEYIDGVSIKNTSIFDLNRMFSKVYNKDTYDRLLEESKFFKLTYKKNYLEYNKEGNLTNYGYFMKED